MPTLNSIVANNSAAKFAEVLPKLYAQENLEKQICFLKFFLPGTGFTWYIMEFDGEDTFFGYANLGDTQYAELGYSSLSELSGLQHGFCRVELDKQFVPAYLADCKKHEEDNSRPLTPVQSAEWVVLFTK
ncbi:DUF2958 domain-containing protein [Azospira sp. APE16]|uniref:DUF2958 domain-containing protein n=1 Tax=Azospira sp. APE16 TaxID=3394231 RepID=UPI003A4D81C7